ncbi:MAG: imidazole glycerol phosphate synthase subunit HisH [Candidatus Helarchaeota archaeon]
MTKINVIDYGMGNLLSISKGLEKMGADVKIINYKDEGFEKKIKNSDGLVIPGVGAFRDAMINLNSIKEPLLKEINDGKPLLGICLGFQLFFTDSTEGSPPIHKGLDLIKGHVLRFPNNMIVPHMGWNSIEIIKDSSLVEGIPNGTFFYFVHSYHGMPENRKTIVAKTRYHDMDFVSIVQKESIFATQFHPEKSSDFGLKMLGNFIKICKQ